MIWYLGIAVAVGYVLGSLPVGYLVARAHGVDIFKAGSGNPGATNVKRVLGAKAGHTVPKGWYNLNRMLTVVMQQRGDVGVCGSCMDARGLTDGDLD